MSLMINHNITSLNAWRNLTTTDRMMSKSMEKLSSGLRVNRASDDPAGLVISEKMRSQLSGLNAASKNVEKAINFVATAEGALDKVNSLLLKMRSLAVDSANGAVNDADMFAANQAEFSEAISSITRISDNTQFGTKKLLDGSVAGATFQVGSDAGQTVSVTISDMDATALGVDVLVVSDAASASAAITTIDTAINTVSTTRGSLGALQADNLEVQYDSLRISFENLQAAESTIRDTDMTKEMAEFTKLQIMMQAGTAMLAQANQLPNNVLQLLR